MFRCNDISDFKLAARHEFPETELFLIPFDELTRSADKTINPGWDGIDSNVSEARLTVHYTHVVGTRQSVAIQLWKVLLEFAVIDQWTFRIMAAAEIHDAERAGQRDIRCHPVVCNAEVCQP